MTLSEKSAYLKGLMEGMKLDTETNEGKLISEIISMLQDVAENVNASNDFSKHITFNTADTPEVLTFKIRTCAPAEDFQGQYILARFHVFVYQKFGRILGILAISYFLAVDINIYA